MSNLFTKFVGDEVNSSGLTIYSLGPLHKL